MGASVTKINAALAKAIVKAPTTSGPLSVKDKVRSASVRCPLSTMIAPHIIIDTAPATYVAVGLPMF
jgi:hypothetical protein